MNLRFIDWIWHVRGSLTLVPEQSSEEAFDRLDPLFQQAGTRHERTGDTLTFHKKDQAAQDKMSVFDSGVLHIEKGEGGSVLRYSLVSRALLFCFLAPLLFLCFAGLTIAVGKYEKAKSEAAGKSGKESEESKKAEKKEAAMQLNPIDKALGAPEPDKPKKDDKAKKEEEENKSPSPKPAYIFATIFAVLYVIGRILEARLIKSLFRKSLLGA